MLWPRAAATDRAAAVPAANLDALAGAGLYGLVGPADAGGLAAPPATVRRVYEALAGACGATFFLWVQHHALVRTLAVSPNDALRRHLLPDRGRGSQRTGVAFAHLRRPGPPAITAVPDGTGWRLTGEAPWMSGWGLVDVMVVAAVTPEDDVVWVVVPARPSDTVTPSPPLALAVLQATRTVHVRFAATPVPAEDVVLTEPLAGWHARDQWTAAQPNPAAYGLAQTAVRLLAERAEARPEAAVTEAAGRLAAELAALRTHGYALADRAGAAARAGVPVGEDPAGALLDEVLAARAESLDLAVRATLALVTASGGGAMEASHPAQRLAREAAFYLVQAQTGAGRAASLARLAHQ